METTATFGETDTGLTAVQMNISVKTMYGAVVDTTGWTMAHSQRGSYKVEVPLCVELATIYLEKKTDPTIFYDGFMGGSDPWRTELPADYISPQAGYIVGRLEAVVDKFTAVVAALLSSSYIVGQISNPYSIIPGGSIQMYAKSNYKGIATVGAKWTTFLKKKNSKVFFVAKAAVEGVAGIDAECTISDEDLGVIDVILTRLQTSVKTGNYYWQLEVRTYTDAPVPVLEEVWMMQEGTLQMKSSFKLW